MNKDGFSILGMYSDYNFQFTNLLFLLTPLAKAIYDAVFHENKNIPTDHTKSLALFTSIGIVLAVIDFHFSPVHYLLQPLLLQVVTFWVLFDYLDNYLAKKKWYYIEENPGPNESWIEQHVYSMFPVPIAWLFAKLWVFLLGFCVYYYFSYI